jgi:hypothetical protein
MRSSVALIVFALALCLAGSKSPTMETVTVSGKFYKLTTAVDVMSIKAIGSPQTKASPSILQVTNEEAERVVKAAKGELIGSPKVVTTMGKQAKITTEGGDSSYSLEVTPSSKGSDTLTLTFRLATTVTQGTRKTTRSARAFARVQESKTLLVIENPRQSQPGFLVALRAQRTVSPKSQ